MLSLHHYTSSPSSEYRQKTRLKLSYSWGTIAIPFFFCIFTHFYIKWKSHMSNVGIAIGCLKITVRGWKSKRTPNKQTKNPRNKDFSLWISLTSVPNHNQMLWNTLAVETYTFVLGAFLVVSRQSCSVGLVARDERLFYFSVLHHILCKSHFV